ncbi:four-carbon acid sugar kinase family protein [Georgenia alba]|uniref:Four-carbon acid sugar kinase family protein n=1 Tax=Georgenia alba TaxID=2233858 RepID=A0ABW2Q2X1_9MICO
MDGQLSGAASRTPVVLADDLSGAAEVAGVALRTGWTAAQVRLGSEIHAPGGGTLTVADLDSRYLGAASARARVETAVRGLPGRGARVAKKIDSLLRGNLEAELAPFLRHGTTVVLCPALPGLGRTVVNGELLLDGVALHETPAWSAERRRAPRSVREALGALPSRGAPLTDVRSGALPTLLRSGDPCVAVCDAVDDADLRLIADAAHQHDVVLAGSADLIGHLLSRSRPAFAPATPVAVQPRPEPAHRVLGVVGTAAPIADRQLAHTAATPGVLIRRLDLKDLVAGDRQFLARTSCDLAAALVERSVCIAVDAGFRPGRTEQRRVKESLAQIVADAVAHDVRIALFLTGGETARAVLDRLSVTTLPVYDEVHHGAVIAGTSAGRLVAIRPGSFGNEASITQVFRALGPERTITRGTG